jgi:hypothetical protein
VGFWLRSGYEPATNGYERLQRLRSVLIWRMQGGCVIIPYFCTTILARTGQRILVFCRFILPRGAVVRRTDEGLALREGEGMSDEGLSFGVKDQNSFGAGPPEENG